MCKTYGANIKIYKYNRLQINIKYLNLNSFYAENYH